MNAGSVKLAYQLDPGDITGLGTVYKAISGGGRTEIWFKEYPKSVSHTMDSCGEVRVTGKVSGR
jgi:hypothetical protein